MLVSLLWTLIPSALYGFGRETDQRSGQPCSNAKHVEDLDTMEQAGSLQWANVVGARAEAPARALTA